MDSFLTSFANAGHMELPAAMLPRSGRLLRRRRRLLEPEAQRGIMISHGDARKGVHDLYSCSRRERLLHDAVDHKRGDCAVCTGIECVSERRLMPCWELLAFSMCSGVQPSS